MPRTESLHRAQDACGLQILRTRPLQTSLLRTLLFQRLLRPQGQFSAAVSLMVSNWKVRGSTKSGAELLDSASFLLQCAPSCSRQVAAAESSYNPAIAGARWLTATTLACVSVGYVGHV